MIYIAIMIDNCQLSASWKKKVIFKL